MQHIFYIKSVFSLILQASARYLVVDGKFKENNRQVPPLKFHYYGTGHLKFLTYAFSKGRVWIEIYIKKCMCAFFFLNNNQTFSNLDLYLMRMRRKAF